MRGSRRFEAADPLGDVLSPQKSNIAIPPFRAGCMCLLQEVGIYPAMSHTCQTDPSAWHIVEPLGQDRKEERKAFVFSLGLAFSSNGKPV